VNIESAAGLPILNDAGSSPFNIKREESKESLGNNSKLLFLTASLTSFKVIFFDMPLRLFSFQQPTIIIAKIKLKSPIRICLILIITPPYINANVK